MQGFIRLMKVFKIGYKLRYPISIHGGTGDGKTHLLNFYVTCLLGDHFRCYTIDSGTTKEEFLDTMVKYAKEAKALDENDKETNNLDEKKNFHIVIDELNTCLFQAVIQELVLNRFSSQHPELSSIPSNILFATP